jgi:hypothetical protein
VNVLELAQAIGCRVAAKVDLVHGDILDRYPVEGAPSAAREEEVISLAVEMMRSDGRPARMLLLTEDSVHLYGRLAASPRQGSILVLDRTRNLGMLLSDPRLEQLRARVEA